MQNNEKFTVSGDLRNVFFSPLAQFQIFELFALTNYSILSLIQLSVSTFFLSIIFKNFNIQGNFAITAARSFFSEFYTYILSTTIQLGYYYLFYFVFLFFILITNNLFGLFPYSFSLTSQISFTFALALGLLGGINLAASFRFRGGFLALFLPEGTPFLIRPTLILIELVSYIARLFSLSIRLFANIMAGHTLMHIILVFVSKILLGGRLFAIIFFIPFALSQLIFFMEVGISMLQAYVFVTLGLNYLNDLVQEGH